MDDSTLRAATAGMPVRCIRLTLTGETGAVSTVFTGERVRVGSAQGNDLVIGHPTVSRFHLTLERDAADVRLTDLGSTNGTRVGAVLLRDSTVVVTQPTSLVLGDIALELGDGDVVMQPLYDDDELSGVRGRSPAMRRVFAQVQKLAQSDVSVLLIGESGTGKELIARAIHDLGPRRRAPFVVVDCAALPPSLFAAELFGHERGAFTGAERRRAGALERAHGGTVFLDELGELPPELQATLLGALERRSFLRLGGTESVPVDVRVVSATNRDLRREVNTGVFRLDLFYRVAVTLIEIPPLRRRPEDVPLLIRHFARELSAEADVDRLFPEPLVRELERYDWPGNARELRNVVASAIALDQSPSVDHVGNSTAVASDAERAVDSDLDDLLHTNYREARSALLQRFERRYLSALLDRSEGNVRRAAREGGINRSYLIDLLKRHGIK